MGDGGHSPVLEARPLARQRERLAAIDVLRGFIMILMAIDHASGVFNAGRLFTDGARFWTPGSPLPPGQFATRWITHLCAPSFVFLAGASLAISVAARQGRGEAPGAVDRHIVIRGALIVAFELAWMSLAMVGPGRFLLQVLYAIGASLICMAALRRLGDAALLGLGLGLAAGNELAAGLLAGSAASGTVPPALVVSGGIFFDRALIVAYPVLPWLAIMCLGWIFGRRLVRWDVAAPVRAPRVLFAWAAGALALFVVVRGLDRYGNMGLHRDDGTLAHWLHVSKYPPSLSFTALELGIMATLLAVLFAVTARRPDFARPLRVLGQTALFFYLLHIHLMHLVAWIFDVEEKLGLASAYVGGVGTVIALYPVCAWYRRFKAAHPRSLARFV
jgi:uncharacterized membrane protein